MNNVRTVSDTKRAFYSTHTRPINSIYRRVVEELMVEMHLLTVNADFCYDPIYALGVVTTFDRFMQGYRPETDQSSIFNALCEAVGASGQQYRQDAEQLQAEAARLSVDEVTTLLQSLENSSSEGLSGYFRGVADNPKFKYSRLFAIGLYTILESIDPELVGDEKRRSDMLQKISEVLHLSQDKIQKDLELYLSNLEKISQAQIVMEDILKADRKKKEERAQAKNSVTTPSSDTPEST